MLSWEGWNFFSEVECTFELHNGDFLTFSQVVSILSSNRQPVNKFQPKNAHPASTTAGGF